MEVRIVFLPDCPLVLSLFKHRDIDAFFTKQMRILDRRSPLYNSIDIRVSLC